MSGVRLLVSAVRSRRPDGVLFGDWDDWVEVRFGGRFDDWVEVRCGWPGADHWAWHHELGRGAPSPEPLGAVRALLGSYGFEGASLVEGVPAVRLPPERADAHVLVPLGPDGGRDVDCTLGGVSARHSRFLVAREGTPLLPGELERPPPAPLTVAFSAGTYAALYPAVAVGGVWRRDPRWMAAGGNYATGDSAFVDLVASVVGTRSVASVVGARSVRALAIHDRHEG